MTDTKVEAARRPIKTRDTKWAAAIARFLKNIGLTPNQISVGSVLFALLAGTCLVLSNVYANYRWAFFVGTAVCIQLRLLCNLFDGMVAVEGGLKTKSGEIYNDFPDRLADPLIIIPAGYVVLWTTWGVELGWAAGLLAVMTAYVRQLGGAAGTEQYFSGPMAKQHRMAAMTICSLLSVGETFFSDFQGYLFSVTLVVLVLGMIITVCNRVRLIVLEMESRDD